MVIVSVKRPAVLQRALNEALVLFTKDVRYDLRKQIKGHEEHQTQEGRSAMEDTCGGGRFSRGEQ